MQTDVGLIKTILLKHPQQAFISNEKLDAEWKSLNYLSRPDFEKANQEYDEFVKLIESYGVEIHFLTENDNTQIDSLYVRDALLVSNKGVILANMGKAERQTEPLAMKEKLESLGIPVLGQITGEGQVEGGDVAWIDERTLAIARGYRTNDEGARQLKALLGDAIDEMVIVQLPHFKGPSDVFHLMSIYSPIAEKAAVVYSPLMPVSFRELLLEKGIKLIEVPDEEYESMGCNVLAVAPGKCIMVKGSPITKQRIIDAGYEVHEYCGEEISLKGCGGPTCLTRPLWREKAV